MEEFNMEDLERFEEQYRMNAALHDFISGSMLVIGSLCVSWGFIDALTMWVLA